MTDILRTFNARWLRHLRMAAACALCPALLSAQSTEDSTPNPGPPPNFVPPPPPNWTPPTPPPNFTPPAPPSGSPQTSGAATPNRRTPTSRPPAPTRARPNAEATSAANPVLSNDSPGINATGSGSALVDTNDPDMQASVGLPEFVDIGTNDILAMLENYTRKPILRTSSLPPVTISFAAKENLTRAQAITAIESMLALNGIAVTPLGDKFLKAVPIASINAQGAPIWEGSTLDATPTHQLFEKVFELDFLNAIEAQTFVKPMMSTGNDPLAYDKGNFIVVTDALQSLQRIERLLAVIDKPAALNTEILFFELQNIGAEDAMRRLQQMQQGALKRQLENNTAFDADRRTNQLIVFTHPSNKALIENLVTRLDIDVAPTTATEVFSIRYADATEVVTIIEQIITGQRQVRSETSGSDPAAAAAAARAAQQARQNNQATTAARAEATNLQFSDFLTIVPDERANTIVASGTHNDLRFLKQLIEEIDTLLAQVRIEVVVAEVRLDDNQTRGIDSFGFSYNLASPGSATSRPSFNVDDGTNNVDQKFATPGDFYGVTIPGVTWGPDGFGLSFVLNAAKTNSNVTVLSAPTVVTTHNKEAIVSVGEERPVITGVTSSSSGDNIVTQDQVQFKEIKLELKVTPLIGSDGVVQLEIDQQIQSVIGTVTVNNNDQPIVGTRKATSYVSVADNELIVLGGLQSIDVSEAKARMAIFGRIPIIGDLFSSKNDNTVRNELLIFIRPTIIRSTLDANNDANMLIERLPNSDRLRSYLQSGQFDTSDDDDAAQSAQPRRRFQP